MFKAAIVSFLIASAALVSGTHTTINGQDIDCAQDNCYRAVGRTYQGPQVYAQHMASCATAVSCQSTPAAATATTAVTVTQGVTTIYVNAVTVQPTPVSAVLTCPTAGIPSDQSSQCNNDFTSYTNACLCNGVSATTSVFATPTITATITSTVPAIVYATGQVVAL
ncbi:uncharacterized protein I206_105737 [Kwoniella pini CBS 10737]|uniref:CBM1 domain-containing protein n=1 Tax=Kwoniella pini CBS 10737 TaxID=1296096 RepID=A0A1B9I3E4_9TREE|nr:uncharacterized protein I206_03360 [Kwoniella pini CBS 10737]OCF50044.1 hypothetical protein I206_03360 [Kwoniella pini CBS 10737]